MVFQDIQVYYVDLSRPLTKACSDLYMNLLPAEEQLRISNYKREEDRLSALAAKALLMLCIKQMGISADWRRLKRNAYGKPYLEGSEGLVNFNISHSGSYAVVAISTKVAVGVDIESIRPIQVDDFENCFTLEEWQTIRKSNNSLTQFFTYWSIKEAAIKAAGKGLSIPLTDVHITEGLARIGAEQYVYREIALHEAYSLAVAAPAWLPHPIVPVDKTAQFD